MYGEARQESIRLDITVDNLCILLHPKYRIPYIAEPR